MGIRIAVLVVALVALASPATLAAGPSPALSPGANQSIALYKAPGGGKPGRLWTGVLAGGVFVQKKAFRTGRWSDIAVGRDTMALYDRKSGKLVTGTLKGGVFKAKASRTVAKGYGLMAASCDSVALYKQGSGELLTAELTSGQYRDPRKTNVGAGFELMEASCDTLYLIDTTTGSVDHASGVLDHGYYDHVDTGGALAMLTHVAANRTSRLTYSRSVHRGEWGSLLDGMEVDDYTFSDQFRTWDLIAGVGDDIVFYRRGSGLTSYWRLIDGVIVTGFPDVTWKQKGLTIIAGGR